MQFIVVIGLTLPKKEQRPKLLFLKNNTSIFVAFKLPFRTQLLDNMLALEMHFKRPWRVGNAVLLKLQYFDTSGFPQRKLQQ